MINELRVKAHNYPTGRTKLISHPLVKNMINFLREKKNLNHRKKKSDYFIQQLTILALYIIPRRKSNETVVINGILFSFLF